jgi:hypothetical protein
MKMISHEIPLALIDKHQRKLSDYMYVLLHKLIEDPVYAQKAFDYKASGGTVYMDNSCFELGESLEDDLLYEWCEKLNPDIVVLPDVLGDRLATLDRTFGFLDRYPHVASYGMAVAQGSSRQELIECYADMRDYRSEHDYYIEMLALPFVFKWIDRDPEKQANERIDLIDYMDANRVIDRGRRHHLLGTWQAREFAYYRKYGWISSIDTSNPIMAAIDGDAYGEHGLSNKPKSTFDSVYDMLEVDINMDMLYNNVEQFRRIVNG